MSKMTENTGSCKSWRRGDSVILLCIFLLSAHTQKFQLSYTNLHHIKKITCVQNLVVHNFDYTVKVGVLLLICLLVCKGFMAYQPL